MRPLLRSSRSVALVLSAAVTGGCGERGSEPATVVFAAASLTGSFQALARAFASLHPATGLDLHFAGTPTLVVQVREGARADVFAAADEVNMAKVVALGRTTSPPRTFATNRLTVVVGRGNPARIQGLADLGRADLLVVLCGPEVPAGRYARLALAKAGVEVRSISDEPSVKAVVSKVQLGEVDAGIVYLTDAAAAREHVDAVPIADSHNVVATYPIAVLDAGGNRATADRFVAFVLSPAGQRILADFGFSPP